MKDDMCGLIQSVLPQVKELTHDLTRLAAQRIVVHGVGNKLLGVLDLGGSGRGQIKVNIHIIDVGCSIDRHLVLGQLSFIVEGRPFVCRSQDFSRFLELCKFRVGLEHILVNLEGKNWG